MRRHDVRLQLRQRIARPFGVHLVFRFVRLRVLKRMALQARHGEPQQHRPAAAAHMRHRFARSDRAACVGIGAVAVEHVQACEARQVLRRCCRRAFASSRAWKCRSRCLRCRTASAASASSPSSAPTRSRSSPPTHRRRARRRSRRHTRDRPARSSMILDRLRVAGGRRVLRADAAAHRQRRRAVRVRIVEHDADIAPVGIAAGAAHRRAQRIFQRHAERQAGSAASDNSRRSRRSGA